MKLRRGGVLIAVTVPAALLVQGCLFDPPDCELCVEPGIDVCIPAEGHKPPPDACGTFVSSSLGDDAAAGSKAAPLRSLGAALARANPGARIYACGELFEEAVVVPPAVSLFGGLDCTDGFWYAPTLDRTEIVAPRGVPAITVTSHAEAAGLPETRIVDVRAVAAARDEPGASSIAAIVDHAAVVFVRTTLVATDAVDGADGAPADEPATPGEDGQPGAQACTHSIVPGGPGVATACADTSSTGGEGGDGGSSEGEDGEDGAPLVVVNHGTGATTGVCIPGTPGAPGAPGETGKGGTSLGAIDRNGYTGQDGTDGTPGTLAQGGGGGGGAKGGTGPWGCPSSSKAGGASGGGGGAGGCGGKGGRGGKAGGSSIAIISLSSTILFEESTLVAGRGGDGGQGGPGQLGGLGGKSGAGGPPYGSLAPGCQGGPGGAGGRGGRGGGAAGGHSLGVAFSGAELALHGANVSVSAPGKGGSAAAAGFGDDPGAGKDGLAAATLEFAP